MKQSITCKFCGRETNRPANSHIIPQGFLDCVGFKPGQIKQRILLSNGESRIIPIGVYDQTILCDECETKQFACDDYAISTLKQHKEAKEVTIGQQGAFLFDSPNRRTLRRWMASVLWRASVSSQDIFKDVELEPAWATRIRDELAFDGDFNFIDAIVEWLQKPIYKAIYGVFEVSPDQSQWQILVPNLKISVFMKKETDHGNLNSIPNTKPALPESLYSISSKYDAEKWAIPLKDDDADLCIMLVNARDAQSHNKASCKMLEKDVRHLLENKRISLDELAPAIRHILLDDDYRLFTECHK